ncbi:MAG: hypothetical protein HKN07_06410 [Acidimicrobiia bacterium]|nr:dienelactone hydrolase family protein [Acidimicrobiia bacterium]NNF63874.1 hypothetical protein [Acidimicrobiia bacterium]
MAKTIQIQWAPEEVVTGMLAEASETSSGVLLAHGAGAGQDHPFMVAARNGLVSRGHTVLTFNYAYTEAKRKRPDAPGKLLAVHLAAARTLAERVENVFLAGKSMGGRMGSHLAAGVDQNGKTVERFDTAGLVYFGYPLVAMGKTEPRDTSHLQQTRTRSLFLAGTRDALGPIEIVRSVVAKVPDSTLHEVPDANHSFHVPKRTGRTDDEVMGELIEVTDNWIRQTAGR